MTPYIFGYILVGASIGGVFVFLEEHGCPTWNDLFVGMFVGAFIAFPLAALAICVSPVVLTCFGIGFACEEMGKTKAWKSWLAFLNSPVCRPAKIKN